MSERFEEFKIDNNREGGLGVTVSDTFYAVKFDLSGHDFTMTVSEAEELAKFLLRAYPVPGEHGTFRRARA